MCHSDNGVKVHNLPLHIRSTSNPTTKGNAMIETLVIVFAIGVFALFATLMVLAAILLFWINK
jgi:hypothetical protein